MPVLAKTLVLSTDDAPELDRDLEGMVVLSPHELLLVNDNDCSVEGARTRFWRIRLKAQLFKTVNTRFRSRASISGSA